MILDELNELEKESRERKIPIIGREKGEFILEKVQELKPKKILELGTANGYSGIILGSEGAELTTIDIDKKITEEAKNNFLKFNITSKIIIGNGVDEIKLFEDKTFDLIFIDFAKKKYIDVLEEAIRVLKEDGTIIADNITFEGCQDFKEKVLKHPKLDSILVNIKDGMSFSTLKK